MRVFSALLVALLLSPAPARATSWPDLIDSLTQARGRAELCVGLIKARVKSEALQSAQFTYGSAKAEIDGVIAGLKGVLAEGGRPDRRPQLLADLSDAGAKLQTLCDAAARTAQPDTMAVWDEVVKAAVEPLIKAIADGVRDALGWAAEQDKITEKTREALLEAAKWPAFDKIEPPQ